MSGLLGTVVMEMEFHHTRGVTSATRDRQLPWVQESIQNKFKFFNSEVQEFIGTKMDGIQVWLINNDFRKGFGETVFKFWLRFMISPAGGELSSHTRILQRARVMPEPRFYSEESRRHQWTICSAKSIPKYLLFFTFSGLLNPVLTI